MSNQVVAAPRPQIHAGAQVAALVPQTLDEAFRVAQAIASSGMAPRGMEKPEQVMVAIMAGAELGFAPFQSLQSFAVVNGRPTLWGDGLVAVIRRNGCTIREWHEGDTAFCEVTRPDTGETITRSFSQADAVKAGLAAKTGPWQQYPQRMRAMRARAWAGRDGCADMLRGFQIAEEAEDYQTVREVRPTAPAVGLAARLAASAPAAEGFNVQNAEPEAATADHDTTTGEIIDAEIEEIEAADDFPGDQPAPVETVAAVETVTEQPKLTIAERAAAFRKRMAEATNPLKLKSIRKAAENLFDDMERSDPEGRVELAFEYEERLLALEEAEREGAGA